MMQEHGQQKKDEGSQKGDDCGDLSVGECGKHTGRKDIGSHKKKACGKQFKSRRGNGKYLAGRRDEDGNQHIAGKERKQHDADSADSNKTDADIENAVQLFMVFTAMIIAEYRCNTGSKSKID